jgi:hypothetical protein
MFKSDRVSFAAPGLTFTQLAQKTVVRDTIPLSKVQNWCLEQRGKKKDGKAVLKKGREMGEETPEGVLGLQAPCFLEISMVMCVNH